ncbi:MAG: hypothetical protein ACREOE_06000 [Gemmatimonadales bacterium]
MTVRREISPAAAGEQVYRLRVVLAGISPLIWRQLDVTVPTSLILTPARENPGGLPAGAQLNTASELAVRTLPPLAVPLLLNHRACQE